MTNCTLDDLADSPAKAIIADVRGQSSRGDGRVRFPTLRAFAIRVGVHVNLRCPPLELLLIVEFRVGRWELEIEIEIEVNRNGLV